MITQFFIYVVYDSLSLKRFQPPFSCLCFLGAEFSSKNLLLFCCLILCVFFYVLIPVVENSKSSAEF